MTTCQKWQKDEILFCICLVSRVFLLSITCTSYMPDEYFQYQEIVSKIVFGRGIITWEWSHNFRIRSFVSLLPSVGLGLATKAMGLECFSAAFLCRVFHCTMAVASDYCFIKFVRLLKFEFPVLAVFINLFSWSGLYMLNRSLANSLEYSSVLIGSFLLLRFATYRDYYSFYFSLAAVVFSTYVRPTAALFWAPLLIQILWHFNNLFREMRFLMQIVAVSLCILLSCIVIDSAFYGEFTVAPWNFFVINVLEKKAAYFGVKPWHFAFTEGLPVVLALFFPLLFLISPANLAAMAKLTRVLLLSALSYVVLLQATSSHQEHRFYLPVIPYLHLAVAFHAFSWNNKFGPLIRGYASLSTVAHALLATYLLKFHQSGGERVMHLLNTKYQPFSGQKIHIIMHAPCYSFPGYAQLLPSPSSYEIYTPSCLAPWEMELGGNINEQFDFMLSAAHGRRLPIDELYVLTFDGFYNSTNYLEHGLKVVENVTHAHFDFDLDEQRPMLRVVLYRFDYSLLEVETWREL